MRCVLVAILISIEALAAELVRRNGVDDDFERGAFLIRDGEGNAIVHEWPTRGFRTASWDGPLPEGVFAVIHTHPVRMPRPSHQDLSEAARLGMPFYVATRTSLCVARPDRVVECRSAEPRAKKRRVPAAGHDRLAAALQMNPKR